MLKWGWLIFRSTGTLGVMFGGMKWWKSHPQSVNQSGWMQKILSSCCTLGQKKNNSSTMLWKHYIIFYTHLDLRPLAVLPITKNWSEHLSNWLNWILDCPKGYLICFNCGKYHIRVLFHWYQKKCTRRHRHAFPGCWTTDQEY